MVIFEKLSHHPKTSDGLLKHKFDELIRMHDYFQEDQIELYEKYDVYRGKPHVIEIRRFRHFRELLSPITILKEKLARKQEELRKHREIVRN